MMVHLIEENDKTIVINKLLTLTQMQHKRPTEKYNTEIQNTLGSSQLVKQYIAIALPPLSSTVNFRI